MVLSSGWMNESIIVRLNSGVKNSGKVYSRISIIDVAQPFATSS